MSTTIKMAKKAKRPMDTLYLSNLGIQSYDADNLYPQNVRKIVLNSKTGCGCMSRYISFLEGNGITDTQLSQMKVNGKQTLDAIHSLCAADLGMFGGFALHVNYNILGMVVEVQHIPFENVRLAERDSQGNVTKVVLHPDWSGRLTRNGKPVIVNKDNCHFLDVFNPNPEVVKAQIVANGGIEHYDGQVYYFSKDGYMTYPLSKCNAILKDMSTDDGLTNVSHRNVRNNFLPAGMLSHFRQRVPLPEDHIDGEPQEETVGYFDMVKGLMTDENCCKVAEVEIEDENEVPKFTEFQAHNYDKDFTATTESVQDAIYAAFEQEVFLCIRKGKLGFSGDVINDAENYYARCVRKEQRSLTAAYMDILIHWGNIDNPLPTEPTFEALTIESLVESVKAITNENQSNQ